MTTPVTPDEPLTRFVMQRSHIRPSDNTVKGDAFVPHPYEDLSVNRNAGLTEAEIWSTGENVASQSGKTLYGRGDNQASCYVEQELQVLPDPIPDNQNHAIVVGWPPEKAKQKIIALQIAAQSSFIPNQN